MPSTNNTILIIEDDKILMQALEKKFSLEGYEVSKAYDGEEGKAVLSTKVPSIILLDLIMPRMDGKEYLKYLKSSREFRDIPVIVLTNHGTFENLSDTLKMGANRFLIKADSDLETIVKNVKEVIDESTSPLSKTFTPAQQTTNAPAEKHPKQAGFLLTLAVILLLLVVLFYQLFTWYINNKSTLTNPEPVQKTTEVTKKTPETAQVNTNKSLGEPIDFGTLAVTINSSESTKIILGNSAPTGYKFMWVKGVVSKATSSSLRGLGLDLESSQGDLYVNYTDDLANLKPARLSTLTAKYISTNPTEPLEFSRVWLIPDTTDTYVLKVFSSNSGIKSVFNLNLK